MAPTKKVTEALRRVGELRRGGGEFPSCTLCGSECAECRNDATEAAEAEVAALFPVSKAKEAALEEGRLELGKRLHRAAQLLLTADRDSAADVVLALCDSIQIFVRAFRVCYAGVPSHWELRALIDTLMRADDGDDEAMAEAEKVFAALRAYAVTAPKSRQKGRLVAAAAPGRTRTEDARKRRPRGTRQG